MLYVVAWNSQGGKWNLVWKYVSAYIGKGEGVIGVITEAGWAPWIQSGQFSCGSWYTLPPAGTERLDEKGLTTDFPKGILAKRNRRGLWIPWVKDPDDYDKATNSRCSLGAAICLEKLNCQGSKSFDMDGCLRPTVRISVGPGDNTALNIFAVHLISGYYKKAGDELQGLVKAMTAMVPTNTAAFIVGDMNIALNTHKWTPAEHWELIRTNKATQKSNNELDWALLYNPTGNFKATVVQTVAYGKQVGESGSDHSMIVYGIDAPQ